MMERWRRNWADRPDNIKTDDLINIAGEASYRCLDRLWFYMDIKHTDGILRDVPDDLIEKKSKYKGEKGLFIKGLIDSRHACRWRDLENKGKGGRGYIETWYHYKHIDSPKFEVPDDDDLVFLGWYERNPHFKPDEISLKSERGRRNQRGKKDD